MNHKWEGIANIIIRNSKLAEEFVRNHSTNDHGENEPVETILHLATRFHPPLNVVQFLFEAHPRAAFEVDRMGRLPLHLATKAGASPTVVRFLLLKNPNAASRADVLGKTPLHLACEHYMFTYDPAVEGRNAPPVEDAIKSVVDDLCKLPECVNMEDMNGMSALEYAIDSDCPLKVVKKLQKSSEKQWKASQNSSVASGGQSDLVMGGERKPMRYMEKSRQPIFGSRQKKKKSNRLAASSA